MKYGENGDKFYIVLKGKIALYKPIYNRKEMTLQKYTDLMYDIKYHELDQLKFDRMIEKNNHLIIDVEILFKLDSNAQSMKQKSYFFIEEDQLLGIFSDGFPFGEIALMKNCTRNASVKAIDETYCISLTKSDYNKIIRELEQKRLEKSLNMFKRDFPLFENWPNNLMLKIFNSISKLELLKGDYLSKQNQDSDFIYLINNGTFELYSMISYGWVQNFYSYIINAKGNIVKKMIDKKLRDIDLKKIYDNLLINNQNSPFQFDPYQSKNGIVSHFKNIGLVDLKNEDEKILNSNQLFKVLIRRIDYKDIIGLEDALECKKRFYYVKCISDYGEIQKVSVFDFIKVLNLNNEKIKIMF
jgi:CRP-like cAMP-binding protein